MSQPLMKTLARMGPRLKNSVDLGSMDEAATPLDKVRRVACMGDADALSTLPPVCLTDSMVSETFFLYTCDRFEDGIVRGTATFDAAGGFRVAGGAVLSTRAGPIPVAVLVLPEEAEKGTVSIILNAFSTPLAALESEFFDGAFDSESKWENFVARGAAAADVVQWRREAAVSSLQLGFAKTPAFLLDGQHSHLLRYGVTPFLSLQPPQDADQFHLVVEQVFMALQCMPEASPAMFKAVCAAPNVTLLAVLNTLDTGAEPIADANDAAAVALARRPVVTGIAGVVLRCAVDGAHGYGKPAWNLNAAVKHHESDEEVLGEIANEEHVFRMRCDTGQSKATQLTDHSFTLTSATRGLGRPFTTKTLCTTDGTNAERVAEAVAKALFCPEDVELAVRESSRQINASTTTLTTVCTLARTLDSRQAILIVQREEDGRVARTKLVGKERCYDDVWSIGLARCLLFSWVRVVVLDTGRVSELLVRTPLELAAKEPLLVSNEIKTAARSFVVSAGVEAALEGIRSEVAEIKAAVRGIVPAAAPSSQSAPPASRPALLASLKRSLASFESFERRLRAGGGGN